MPKLYSDFLWPQKLIILTTFADGQWFLTKTSGIIFQRNAMKYLVINLEVFIYVRANLLPLVMTTFLLNPAACDFVSGL